MKEPSLGMMGKLVALITVATVIMSAVAEEDADEENGNVLPKEDRCGQ